MWSNVVNDVINLVIVKVINCVVVGRWLRNWTSAIDY